MVAWNSGATLDRCLGAIGASRWGGDLEVVVVDNGSTDGSTADWDGRHPGVELRQAGRNLGFAGGANVGLSDLDGTDAVALVNPDAFVEPGWLAALVEALDADPAVGAAVPKMLLVGDGPARINNVGTEISPRWEPRDRGLGQLDVGQYDEPGEVWGWCGGAVLLRSSYLRDVGLFDERLFMYAEDVDLSWRGRARGWRYRYVPTAVVHHVHRASSGGRRTPLLDYLNRRNRLVVVTRHGGLRGAASAWARALGGLLVATVAELARPLTGRPSGDRGALRRRARAAADAFRLLRGQHPPVPGVDAQPRSTET